MCGIAGILGSKPIAPERLAGMGAVLRHRGPDDSGVWTGGGDGTFVGLVHRRLSIIDLSAAGHQPMCNEDGTIWLTYNGEIYNHGDVRRELEATGHRYTSQTDSETIIHGYEEWGADAISRFRGMFAFAIWDSSRQRLLLVRDRLGVKPLYYTENNGQFAFASEIKALLESGLVKPTPTQGGLAEYLSFGYLAGEETMFAGVRKLPPGHVLTWERGVVSVRRYWDVVFEPDEQMSERELRDGFLQLFEESVRLRLMSDVPLGVFLSGGLDSSAIAAVTSRLIGGRLKTFSVGYESSFYSEFEFARQVAEHIGAEHHEIVVTADTFLDALPRLIWHEDEPLWAPPSVALYYVSELASREVTVVLTGEGSDELFAGYDRYWMTAVNARIQSIYSHVPARVRLALRRILLHGPLPERARRALSHTALNHESYPDTLFFDNWLGVFSREQLVDIADVELRRDLESVDVRASHLDIFRRGVGAEIIDELLYSDIKTNLVELLMKQDQMSMATSIESRVPFLDHKLVEFAARVPARFKVKGTSGKHLVKEALGGYLPRSILHRPKKGFPVPYEEWLRDRYAPDIEAMLLSDRARERRWLKPEVVRRLFAAHRSGRVNMSRHIWALWGLELWARIFIDDERPGLARPATLQRRRVTSAAAAP